MLKELELYKEELLSKPALLVVNKMDLPDAEDKLAELKEQLQNPEGYSSISINYSKKSVIFRSKERRWISTFRFLGTVSSSKFYV